MDFKPTLRSANITNSGSLPIRPVILSSILRYVCAKNWPGLDKLYPNQRLRRCRSQYGWDAYSHAGDYGYKGDVGESTGGNREKLFRENSGDSLVVRATTFQANPRIKRVVFICTPHRGSEMARADWVDLASSLISLPLNIASAMKTALNSAELVKLTGSSKRLPNSITGLKPSNPAVTRSQQASRSRFLITRSSVIAVRAIHRTVLMASFLTGALISMARNPK